MSILPELESPGTQKFDPSNPEHLELYQKEYGQPYPDAPVKPAAPPNVDFWEGSGNLLGATGNAIVQAPGAFGKAIWEAPGGLTQAWQQEAQAHQANPVKFSDWTNPMWSERYDPVYRIRMGGMGLLKDVTQGAYNFAMTDIPNAIDGQDTRQPVQWDWGEYDAFRRRNPFTSAMTGIAAYSALPQGMGPKAGLATDVGLGALSEPPGETTGERLANRVGQGGIPVAGAGAGYGLSALLKKFTGADVPVLPPNPKPAAPQANTAGSRYANLGLGPEYTNTQAARPIGFPGPESHSFTETPLLPGSTDPTAPYSNQGLGTETIATGPHRPVTAGRPAPESGSFTETPLLTGDVSSVPYRIERGPDGNPVLIPEPIDYTANVGMTESVQPNFTMPDRQKAPPQSGSFTETPLLTGDVTPPPDYSVAVGQVESAQPNFTMGRQPMNRIVQGPDGQAVLESYMPDDIGTPLLSTEKPAGLLPAAPSQVDTTPYVSDLQGRASHLSGVAEDLQSQVDQLDTNVDTPIADSVQMEITQQEQLAAQAIAQGQIQTAERALLKARELKTQMKDTAIGSFLEADDLLRRASQELPDGHPHLVFAEQQYRQRLRDLKERYGVTSDDVDEFQARKAMEQGQPDELETLFPEGTNFDPTSELTPPGKPGAEVSPSEPLGPMTVENAQLIKSLEAQLEAFKERWRVAVEEYNSGANPHLHSIGLENLQKEGARLEKLLQVAKYGGRRLPKGAKPGRSLNPAEVGVKAGGKAVSVLEAIGPGAQQLLNRFTTNPGEVLYTAAQGFRQASDTLNMGDDVAEATLRNGEVRSAYLSPVENELAKVGYDTNNPIPAVESGVDQLFRNNDVDMILSGKVNLNSYGIPAEMQPAVMAMANALSPSQGLPAMLGFKGLGRYYFGQGYQHAPTLLFDVETGRPIASTPVADEYRNSSIFHHRETALNPTKQSVFAKFITHVTRMAHQYAAAPLLLDENGNAVMKNGKYQLEPGSLYEKTFSRFVDPNATPAEKAAADAILDNITGHRSPTTFDKLVRAAQGNIISGVLNHRISAGLKNYPTLFAQTDVPIMQLMESMKEVATNPQVRRIMQKYGIRGFTDIELMKLGVSRGKAEGVDTYQVLQQHATSTAFWGKVTEEAKRLGVGLDELEAGKTPRAREILKAGLKSVKSTEGSYSVYDPRPNLKNPLANWYFMFKQPKLTEIEQIGVWAKNKDWKQLGRYLTVKYLIAGPANVLDAQTSNFLLASGAAMDPSLQQFLEDARDGQNAVKATQEMMPDFMNLDVRQSVATPMFDVKDVPILGEMSSLPALNDAYQAFANPEGSTAERVEAIAGGADKLTQALPSANIGGVKVSPNLIARTVAGTARLTMPSEEYKNTTIDVDKSSEVARVFMSGNKEKNRIRPMQDEKSRLNKDFRRMMENPTREIKASVHKQINRFVDNYGPELAKKYETNDPQKLKELLFQDLNGGLTTEDGTPNPTQKEWSNIVGLMENMLEAQRNGEEKRVESYMVQYQKARESLTKKYNGLTEDDIWTHYRKGHGSE